MYCLKNELYIRLFYTIPGRFLFPRLDHFYVVCRAFLSSLSAFFWAANLFFFLLCSSCHIMRRATPVSICASFCLFFYLLLLYCSFFSFSISFICCFFLVSWGMDWLTSSLQLCHSVALFCQYICWEKVSVTCSGSVYNCHKLQKTLLHLLRRITEVGRQNCREFLTRPK